jgi:hypothetical protein
MLFAIIGITTAMFKKKVTLYLLIPISASATMNFPRSVSSAIT